jgi:3-phenylpropionate/trans-cinnamate dioxygenase ferredoxin subunit
MSQLLTVATADEIAPGKTKIVEVGGRRIGIVRGEGGRFYAIEDRCTHDDGPLAEGEVIGECILCPRHGAKFDLATGMALTLPAFGHTGSWRVVVEGDDVKVEVP